MQRKLFNSVIAIAFIALALLLLRSNQIARDQAAALAKLQRKTEALEKQLAANPNAAASVLDTEAQILRSAQQAALTADTTGPSFLDRQTQLRRDRLRSLEEQLALIKQTNGIIDLLTPLRDLYFEEHLQPSLPEAT